MAARKTSSTSQRGASSVSLGQLSAAGKRWWGASACLLGTLLVWSLLQPVDAISVFQGAATAQNFAWLTLAPLTAAGCIACGVRYKFTARAWWIISEGLLWFLVATVLAGRENNPRVAWYGFWQVVSLAACYYSASALLPGPRSRRAALQILLVGCVALALQGLEQVLIEMPAARAEYLADPEAFLAQDPELDMPAGSPMRKRFEDRLLYSAEPYATFALTNSLAVLLSGGLVILCGLAWTMWLDALRRSSSPRSGQIDSQGMKAETPDPSPIATRCLHSWLPLVALALAILVVGACWFLTRSRVAYLSMGLICLAWGVVNATRLLRHRWLLVGISTVVSVLLLAGGWWLWHYDRLVFSEAPKSLSYRLEYWVATLAMLGDHAWWGVGLGNFQSYYPLYKLPTASEIVADPHNWPLDLCVSLSLPVGLLLIGWLGLRLLSGLRESFGKHSVAEVAQTTGESSVLDAWSQRCLLWGAVIGGTVCLGLLNLLSGLEISVISVTWLLAAGLIACLRGLKSDENSATSASLRPAICAAVVAMLLCLLASGSWQASGLAVPLLIGLVLINRRRESALSSSGLAAADAMEAGAAGKSVEPSKLRRFRQVAIVVIPAVGLLGFLMQSWRPTAASWALLQEAQRTPDARGQLALVEAAAEADWLDSEPLRWRAQMLSGQALVAPSDRFALLADQSLSALDVWLARDSTKYSNWKTAGERALELAEQARKLGFEPQKWLDASMGYYSQSVARYPSSVGLNAQLAAVLAIADRWPEAQQQRQVAERLDQATPHEDQKLASQQLWLPILPQDAVAEFAQQQPRIMAEPVLNWLRKHNAE